MQMACILDCNSADLVHSCSLPGHEAPCSSPTAWLHVRVLLSLHSGHNMHISPASLFIPMHIFHCIYFLSPHMQRKRTLGRDVWRRDCHCVFATLWQTLCCPCRSCDFHVDFQLSDTFTTYLKVFFRFFSRFIAYYGENIFLGWIPRPVPDLFQDCPLSSFRKRQCHMPFITRHSQETSTSTNPYYAFTS